MAKLRTACNLNWASYSRTLRQGEHKSFQHSIKAGFSELQLKEQDWSPKMYTGQITNLQNTEVLLLYLFEGVLNEQNDVFLLYHLGFISLELYLALDYTAFHLVKSELHINWNSVPIVGGIKNFRFFSMWNQSTSPSQGRQQQSKGDMRKLPKECADAKHALRVLWQKRHLWSWYCKGKTSEISHHPHKAQQLGEHRILKHFTEATNAHLQLKRYFKKTKVRQPSERMCVWVVKPLKQVLTFSKPYNTLCTLQTSSNIPAQSV